MKEVKSKKQSIKIDFDLSNDQDIKILELIQVTHEELNDKKFGTKITRSEVLKSMITPLKKEQVSDMKMDSIEPKERINLWIEAYSKIHKKTISKDLFIVEIMPKLKEKDYENLNLHILKNIDHEKNV